MSSFSHLLTHSLKRLCAPSYYMEILMQQWNGPSGMKVGMFTGRSSFTEEQSDDAVNEVQVIVARHDVNDETLV